MPDSPKKFYLTTPIYYVNARPHIGHAYTTVVADVLARRHRLLGDDTFFLTGTDEHGQKIERSAIAAGIPPQQFADQVSQTFQHLWKRMGITHDAFIRTSDRRHKQGVQHLFQTLRDRGYIYLSTYTGQYCVSDEAYVDGPPGIRCPDCGRTTETVSESNFYFKLSAFQLPLLNLIEPGPHGEPAQLDITPDSRRNEVLSFVRGLGAYFPVLQEQLDPPHLLDPAELFALAVEHDLLRQTAQGFHYLPGALKDLSISRTSFKWGIPVPGDEAHVIYVWLDALANYMTAIGYGSDNPQDQAHFERFWPADLHLVGKEIIRFHCVYWPAFLLALNPATALPAVDKDLETPDPDAPSMAQSHRDIDGIVTASPAPNPGAPSFAQSAKGGVSDVVRPYVSPAELPLEDLKAWAGKWLPKAITAHGWLLFDDAKMSKSKGNIVRTETILDAFGDHYRTSIAAHNQKLAADPAPNSASLKGTASALPHLATSSTGQPALPQPATLSTGEAAVPHLATSSTGQPASLKGTASAVPSPHAADTALAAEVRSPSKHDADLFASDVLRYFLLREIPFGQDGSFSFDALITRYNADLANGYGNLVSRTLSMIVKYFAGLVPHPLPGATAYAVIDSATESEGNPQPQFLTAMTNIPEMEFASQLQAIFQVVASVDAMITSNAPWKLAAQPDEESQRTLRATLYSAANLIRIITALLYPILPYSTAKVWSQLGLGDIEQAAANGDLKNLSWGGLQPGTKLGSLAPIFPRAPKELAQTMADIESTPKDLTSITDAHDATTSEPTEFPESSLASDATPTPLSPDRPAPAAPTGKAAPPPSRLSNETTTTAASPVPASSFAPDAGPRTGSLPATNPIAQVAGSTATTTERTKPPSHTEANPSGLFKTPASTQPITATNPPAPTPQITIDDFAKVELRVAKILVCERIPKADKLLRLEVDLGTERRQILSGIAEWYTPEDLIGRKIVVITNLAPRKMRGLESHGMLLAASTGDNGKPALATFSEGDNIEVGARLK